MIKHTLKPVLEEFISENFESMNAIIIHPEVQGESTGAVARLVQLVMHYWLHLEQKNIINRIRSQI
jgi:divalent metal cation (Fe/Co/Zn/Cd) transporter